MLPRQTAGLGCQAKLLPSALLSKVFFEVSFEPGHMVQTAADIVDRDRYYRVQIAYKVGILRISQHH
jgi:hypothetical protein